VKQKHQQKVKGRAGKSVLRLPDLEIAKSAVLNSLSCPDAQRGYRHAIDEFVEWYCSEPRLSDRSSSLCCCPGPAQMNPELFHPRTKSRWRHS